MGIWQPQDHRLLHVFWRHITVALNRNDWGQNWLFVPHRNIELCVSDDYSTTALEVSSGVARRG